jgi:hypothetical protein
MMSKEAARETRASPEKKEAAIISSAFLKFPLPW